MGSAVSMGALLRCPCGRVHVAFQYLGFEMIACPYAPADTVYRLEAMPFAPLVIPRVEAVW